MLSLYLNQAAELKRTTGEKDEFGALGYEDPITVRCRHEKRSRDVVASDGRTLRIESVYYLAADDAVKTGDMLDGAEVLFVEGWIALSGLAVGYKAMT